jgi:hypothetical protein
MPRPADYVLAAELVPVHERTLHGCRAVMFAYAPSCPLPLSDLVGRTFRVVQVDDHRQLWLEEVKGD